MTGLVHARQRPPRRSPHRTGRITPANVLDQDPRGHTVCGADPTDRDLSWRAAHTKIGRPYLTCSACLHLTEGSPS